MRGLKYYSKKDISSLLSIRQGETKLGEKLSFIGDVKELENSPAAVVIFGVPEDVGVRANHGKQGTANLWKDFLSAYLNIQDNRFFNADRVLILGAVDTTQEMGKASHIDHSDPNYHAKLGDIVTQIDAKVSEIVRTIIGAGKIPVVIGGGHNNAFGNIKGASQALGRMINVLNIDAHTDLRRPDFRHSGNGFSYAFKERMLKRYAVCGLHQNYTPEYIFEQMEQSEDIHYSLFEDLQKGDPSFHFQKNLDFVKGEAFGLEIDCDVIAGFPSSALSPSGFSLDRVRQFVREAGKEKNCTYLHICEGIATNNFTTGKAVAFLVSDFLKAL